MDDEVREANSSDEAGLDENLVMSATGANNSQDLIQTKVQRQQIGPEEEDDEYLLEEADEESEEGAQRVEIIRRQ